jgi:rubrerythrin
MELSRSNAEIIEEFIKKRTRQIMAVGPIVLAFIALLSVENNPTGIFGLAPSTILVAAFAVIISVLVFSLLNWRCPSCNKYLGKAINPKFCSKCGTQLGEKM